MELVRTIIEDNSEDVIQVIENVLIPCNRGENLYIDGKVYNVWRVTTHIKNLENITVVEKTLWVE